MSSYIAEQEDLCVLETRAEKAEAHVKELEATLFNAQQALLSEGVRSGVIERELHEMRERAEKAERERDEALAKVVELEAKVMVEKACRDHTYAELGRAVDKVEAMELYFDDEVVGLEGTP
jgi:chromosome segregation ATPase